MSSMHYKKGRKKVIQRFFAPFLSKSPFMISWSSSPLVFWVFSTVSLPHKETDEWCFSCLSLYKIQSFTFLPLRCHLELLFALFHNIQNPSAFSCCSLGFESDKNESQNGITAFKCILFLRGMELETLSISLPLQERPTRCFVKEVLFEHCCNLITARFPPVGSSTVFT